MTADTHLTDLRAEVSTWLDANAPKGWRDAYAGMTHAEFAQAQRDWFQALVKGGYAIPHWPAQWPGGGRSLAAQKVIYEELARAGISTFVSMHMRKDTLEKVSGAQMNVVCTGHMSSDSLGMNLFLDELEKKGIEIVPVGGLIRVSRNKKK